VTEDQVDEVKSESLERGVDGLAQVLAIERVLHVDLVVDAPEQLGRDQVLVALPAEVAEGLTHDAFGFASRVRLRVVKEVDAGVLGGA
jgi:hypothetical protein